MKLSFEVATDLKAQDIWKFYADVKLWLLWDDDLESIDLFGEFHSGTKGKIQIQAKPALGFELFEVTPFHSFCNRSSIPQLGELYFQHELIPVDDQTVIRHSIELKCNAEEKNIDFLKAVFANVPKSIFKLIQVVHESVSK